MGDFHGLGGGVLVLGMHRSGTSAITHLLHLGGLETGRDNRLDRGGPANPRGFWEVQALTRKNEAVLRAMDGEWSAPPELAFGWERDGRLNGLRTSCSRTFHRTMPRRAWVWKDPRLCLTTTFWTSLGVQARAVVLVVRNPLEVASSLSARNAFDKRLGLALWERYTREAIERARLLPTVLVDFDGVSANAAGWTLETVEWLRRSGVPLVDPPDPRRLADVFDHGLRHSRQTGSELSADRGVSVEQADMYSSLRESQGIHDEGVRVQLPPPTPWVSTVIAERRAARRDTRHQQTRWRNRTTRVVVRSAASAWQQAGDVLRDR